MAVYTHLGAEEIAALLAAWPVGTLVSAKGIAEGVSNSNWLIETTNPTQAEGSARYILTLYEYRIELDDLPWFLGLLDHLAARGCAVPRTIHTRDGALSRRLMTPRGEKAAALIEFLPGVSLSEPSPGQALAVGRALAEMHLAAADYPATRANGMGLREWQRLTAACGADLALIDRELPAIVGSALPRLAAAWPRALPAGVIHADLFPDNVLMLGEQLTGMIDFYFACHDLFAYDVAVTHAAWCFDATGTQFDAAVAAALLAGYQQVRPLSAAEHAALPLLAQGAALRFTLSRAWDWLNTPADAVVMRKDPMAFARRLLAYAAPDAERLFA